MIRDYLTQQIDGGRWAAVVANLLYPGQVAVTEAAQLCFTSHERGQAGQMLWAVGRVATARGSAEGATETLDGGLTGRRPGLCRRWA